MQKAYLLKESTEIQKISNETYPELMAALKVRNPKAKELIEDEELSQLHTLLPLLRLKQITIQELGDSPEMLFILRIKEDLGHEGDL